ncbi:MAG: CHAD domain-containing protein [Thermomicrobiales bacterium]
MDVAVDAFPASWYRPLHKVAKRITSELGEVRDRDVQIEYLTLARERADPEIEQASTVDQQTDGRTRRSQVHMLAFLEDLESPGHPCRVERRFGPGAVMSKARSPRPRSQSHSRRQRPPHPGGAHCRFYGYQPFVHQEFAIEQLRNLPDRRKTSSLHAGTLSIGIRRQWRIQYSADENPPAGKIWATFTMSTSAGNSSATRSSRSPMSNWRR